MSVSLSRWIHDIIGMTNRLVTISHINHRFNSMVWCPRIGNDDCSRSDAVLDCVQQSCSSCSDLPRYALVKSPGRPLRKSTAGEGLSLYGFYGGMLTFHRCRRVNLGLVLRPNAKFFCFVVFASRWLALCTLASCEVQLKALISCPKQVSGLLQLSCILSRKDPDFLTRTNWSNPRF